MTQEGTQPQWWHFTSQTLAWRGDFARGQREHPGPHPGRYLWFGLEARDVLEGWFAR